MEPGRKKNQDITPDLRPDLRVIQGGGETTDRQKDHLQVVDNQDDPSKTQRHLHALENNPDTPDNPDASVNDREEYPQNPADTIKNNFTGAVKSSVKKKFKLTWTKGIIGGGAATGITALIVFMTTLGPAALLANLSSNANIKLDTQSTIMDRRVLKVLDAKLNGPEITSGSCSVVKIACRFTRPSNALLTTLDDFGIKPINKSGDPIEKTMVGFPNERPDRYEFIESRQQILQKPLEIIMIFVKHSLVHITYGTLL